MSKHNQERNNDRNTASATITKTEIKDNNRTKLQNNNIAKLQDSNNNSSNTANKKNSKTTEAIEAAVPKPRLAPTPNINFQYKNYTIVDSNIILPLPIWPADYTALSRYDVRKLRGLIKDAAIDLDTSNDHYIIAYRRDEKWWQIGGNSLLFYIHRLMEPYKLTRLTPRRDNDYGTTWPNGNEVAMIRDISTFVHSLTQQTGATIVLRSPCMAVLALPFSFNDTDIHTMQSILKNKIDRINHLLLPKLTCPQTRQAVDALNKTIIESVSKLTPTQRQYYGDKGAEITSKMSLNFVAMCNGLIPPETYFVDAINESLRLICWLGYVQKFNIFTVDQLLAVSEKVLEVKERLQNELTQIRRKSAS